MNAWITKRGMVLAFLAGWFVWNLDLHNVEMALRSLFVLVMTEIWWKESK